MLRGPLEEPGKFPDLLTAHVVTPGDEPRVHGYDVESDLARHYDPTDLLLLTLTGELPSAEARGTFELAWQFLAPVSVAHASTHAALLARLCGSPTSATIGTAAIGLAEQARTLLDDHLALIEWLRRPNGPPPERYRTTDAGEQAAMSRVRRALGGGPLPPGLERSITRDAGLVCLLYASGLRRRELIEAAVVLFRLPCALAEAFAERTADFKNYPINLPAYVYEEPRP